MRRFVLWIAILAGCSSAPPPPPDPKEDLRELAAMLQCDDPLKREEAGYRIARLGLSVDGFEREQGSNGFVPSLMDTASIRNNVERALHEDSPERLLWRAYHAIRVGSLGRLWKTVRDALPDQGFQFTEAYDPRGGTRFARFTARAGGWKDGAGGKHDLFFWIRTSKIGDSFSERWIVKEVIVGLHVSLGVPFKTLAAQERYPQDGVLGRFLELPDMKRLAVVFPVIEEIELTYGRIRVRDAETIPAGFHVNAAFALAAEGKGGGRGVVYTAESGLDPLEMPSGKLLWEGFTPSLALGPLTPRGSSFWGAGGLRPTED